MSAKPASPKRSTTKRAAAKSSAGAASGANRSAQKSAVGAAKRKVRKSEPRLAPPTPSTARSGDATAIERLRAICLALPEANEKLSHGEPTWFAGKGRVFAMLDNHHHGAPHLSVWLPQPLGAQESLIDVDAERFFRPPYVGPSGWVGVVLDTKPDWRMIADLVRDAYVHVATRKLRLQLEARLQRV
jgi:predicted DNA-binding protein (MmcQ/YjbR family)